jgi:hypothetical protein
MQFADLREPWEITNCAQKFVLQALQFQKVDICRKFPGGADISYYRSI